MSGAFFYCARVEPGRMVATRTTVMGRPPPNRIDAYEVPYA
jgi:hypothetical protein